MTWKLWLDDQILDPETPARHTPEGFLGAKSTEEARAIALLRGPPSFMDLDHDLGGDDTAMAFLRWLTYEYPEGPVPQYRVHSQNPIGIQNIISYMESWRRSLE